MACLNAATPLELPWTNITITADNRAISRGIPIALGNPPQVLSLRPWLGGNDTSVFNSGDCGASNDTCIGLKGGVYSPAKSTTYLRSPYTSWNGTHGRETASGSQIFFNDELQLTFETTAFGFPAYMDEYGKGSQGALGLGPSSDFLNATVGTGVAPTTSLGIWPGSRSVENPVDGLLVIGGYDSARVSGEFTQFQSFQNCFTCAEIVELNYTSSTGSTSLFSNSSEVLQVSFEPFERSLPVPQDIFENFMDASGGYFDSGQGLIAYPRGNPPEGNLSIVLQNGYSSTIPASELFISPRTYGNNGVYSISNDSILVSHVKNTSDPRYVPSWGIPFLTMNYLVVDYQTGHFRLAPAYRQEFGVSSGSLIQPLCSGTGPTSAPSPALPTTSGIAGGNGNSTVSTAIPQPKGHHTNTGAIAGGVAGGIVGLAIILVLGFLLVRQRKRARRAEQQVADAEVTQHKGLAAQKDVSGAGHESTYTATSPTEVSSQELEGKQYRNVNEWLGQHNTHDEATMGANVREPFEMPGEYQNKQG